MQREEDLFEEALKEGDVERVAEYIERYPRVTFEKGRTPIHVACRNGQSAVIQLLIERGCDIECEDSNKWRPIYLACANGHIDVTRLLIEKGCEMECEDSNKYQPIHVTCFNGHVDIIRLLIEQGCDIECEDLNKWRPIHFASMNEQIDVFRLLIEQDCEIECENMNKWRPIHFACLNGHIDKVWLLINKHCDIECEDAIKQRPIHLACIHGHIDVIRLLIEQGCDIECENSGKQTPIHIASWCGQNDVIQLLIKQGCDIEHEDSTKARPIHFACFNGHINAIRLLIEKGCEIECEDSNKLRPIHLAGMNGHIDVVRLLIEQGCDIECETLFKYRLIHFVCSNGHIDVIQLLIDQGCDIECDNADIKRPIHLACFHGHIDVIRLLIEKGCDIEWEDSNKQRPIHLACENGHTDVIRLLIEQGCDIEYEDLNKRTPIYTACAYGHTDIVDLLRERSSRDRCEGNRNVIADKMGLTCGPSCDHKGFCRESLIQQSVDLKTDEIGKGDYGAVYRLRESSTGRRFALKYIQNNIEEEALKTIENYINICLKDLEHENIVKYYGSVTEMSSDDVYIFMEYVGGGSLLEYMAKHKGIPHDKVIWFTKQILEGVSFLHLHRIVHRDIKPANILLDDKENVKLSDFGLSRFLKYSDLFIDDPSSPLAPLFMEYIKNPSPEMLEKIKVAYSIIKEFKSVRNYVEDKKTQPCATGLGTIGYTALEIRKNEPYGLAVDIWSVGTIMFHMLTGRPPGGYKQNFSINKRGFVYDLMKEMVKENPADRPTAILLLKKIEENE